MAHVHSFGEDETGIDEQSFGGHTHRVFGNFFDFPTVNDGANVGTQKGADNDGHTHTLRGTSTGPAKPLGEDLF